MIPFNTLKPQFDRYAEEYLAAAHRVLESGWYVLGPELAAFESAFAAYLGANFSAGVASGLDALTLALKALGVAPGDEVAVPSNTYIATVIAITTVGARPLFVEPDPYHGMDPSALEAALTSNTRAILPVHLYGQPCDMPRIMKIADSRGIPVVEDCAQSHGAAIDERLTGTFGAIGCFSFFPTKNLGAFGDGGAITTGGEEICRRIRMLRNYGCERKYVNETAGMNSRLDEIQAALLSVKLAHLGELTAERERIARRYLAGIRNPAIILPRCRPDCTHCWHLFVVEAEKRDDLQQYLADREIGTQIHYPIPPHLSDAYRDLGYARGDFPIAERLADTVLSLPLYNGMTDADQNRGIEALNAWRP